MPDPIPMIGKASGEVEISKTDLINSWGVSARLPDFLFDLRYQVVSYKMTYMGSNGEKTIREDKGGQWTPRVQEEFKSVKPGQRLTFSEIEYKIKGIKNQKPTLMDGVIIVKIK